MMGPLIGLIEDHLKLAYLEYRYERDRVRRKSRALLLGAAFGLAAFVFSQIAAILGFQYAGWHSYTACLVMAGVNLALAGIFTLSRGRRDPRVGEPFQTSRDELTKTLERMAHTLS
jgi:uncharacterized membrane protein YqjE